jgi:uncharacterized membrane protein YcjF (UPF0283 family)
MGGNSWLDAPGNVRLLWRLFLAVLVLCLLVEIAVTLHPVFGIESLFGFHAWFGFLACVAMIGVAKGLSLLLRRPDTYYQERDE